MENENENEHKNMKTLFVFRYLETNVGIILLSQTSLPSATALFEQFRLAHGRSSVQVTYHKASLTRPAAFNTTTDERYDRVAIVTAFFG